MPQPEIEREAPAPAPAPPGATTVRFVLSDIEIEGATAYSRETLERTFANLRGTQVTLADIHRRTALNFKSRLAFTRLMDDPVEEVAREIDRH